MKSRSLGASNGAEEVFDEGGVRVIEAGANGNWSEASLTDHFCIFASFANCQMAAWPLISEITPSCVYSRRFPPTVEMKVFIHQIFRLTRTPSRLKRKH